MSNDLRKQLLEEFSHAVAEFQSATDLVDEAVAEQLRINRTDLRCLGLLSLRGPLTAGQLAQASGLSPGAITTVVDRLERSGYARRVRDQVDRRSVQIETTPQANQYIVEFYGPIGRDGLARLGRYSDEELVLLRDFLLEGRILQEEHAERIRAAGASSTDT